MTTENIPEIMYSELKKPICPKCEDPLFRDDHGVWYCENPDCKYSQYNNITVCQSDWCDNLVLSKDFNFYRIEDRFCSVKDKNGLTCVGHAYAENEQFIAEQHELEEHQKRCHNENCSCREY